MKKFTIKFIILVFTFYILHFTFYIPAAFAADSTPSADIKAKLEELKKEIASKAAQIKNTVNRKLKDKAYIGTVKTSSEASITLAAESGPKMVSINQDTVFESKKAKQKFSQKTLAEGDYVAALGDIDETSVLTARKLILLPSPQQSKKILWGQIISTSDKLITLKNREQKTIAVNPPSSPKIDLNDFVIVTGETDKDDIFEAEFAYIIPQGATLKPKKIATPSAQPSKKTN